MKAALINRLWLAASRRAARQFEYAAQHLRDTQARLLQTYLVRNRDTVFLRERHFSDLIPTTYEDNLPYITRIADGEQNVLTREPVQLFELSSGSLAASKMIPYTATLKQEFQRALAAWITDLYAHHAGLLKGRAYWSISPLTEGRRKTPGGISIGFEQDSDYLGRGGRILESILAVPNIVKHIRDIDSFRYVTLLYLLRCRDLRLISVWNPTFLTLLLNALSNHWQSLLTDIAQGTLTPPAELDEGTRSALLRSLAVDGKRARELSACGPQNYAAIWPQLELISCWADGSSAPYAAALAAEFPNVCMQPKGLLATEAFVSFPLTSRAGAALAVTSHYFEFQNEAGDILRADQIEKDKSYSVLVTTGGGFYRYQLNDIVEVRDFYGQVPCVRFVDRSDRVSDYFGEKLNERFVAQVLAGLFQSHKLTPSFAMLAPSEAPQFHYALYVEGADLPVDFETQLDNALRANFHYDYCRRLSQLSQARVVHVRRGAETYLQACQARGQKLGDIKPAMLDRNSNWSEAFSVGP